MNPTLIRDQPAGVLTPDEAVHLFRTVPACAAGEPYAKGR